MTPAQERIALEQKMLSRHIPGLMSYSYKNLGIKKFSKKKKTRRAANKKNDV